MADTNPVDQVPQSPTPGMVKRGRAALLVTPLSAFTTGSVNGVPIVPYDGEQCYDDQGDMSIGFIKYTGNEWRFISTSQQVSLFIDSLTNTGLFENALQGVVSKELTYFMFNPISRSVIFNNKLVFPDTFAFYAIRKGASYITRRVLPNNLGETNLVAMRRVRANAETDVFVRKPETGMLDMNVIVVDGESYIVEFFDENQRLIARDTYFAEFAHAFTGSFNAAGIRELRIQTSRAYYDHPLAQHGMNCAFLYRNEDPAQLEILASLVFDDGLSRDVSGEMGGRLQVDWGGLNTQNLSGDAPFYVVFTYTSEELGMVDANTPASITSTLRIFVLEDNEITTLLPRIMPVYWPEPGFTAGDTNHLCVRYFMFGANTFTFFDGTLRKVEGPLGDTLFGKAQNGNLALQRLYTNVTTEFRAGANGAGQPFRPQEYAVFIDYKKSNAMSGIVFRIYPAGAWVVGDGANPGPDRFTKDMNNLRLVLGASGHMSMGHQVAADGRVDPVTPSSAITTFNSLSTPTIKPTHFRISPAPTYLNASGPLYFVSLTPISQITDFTRDAGSLPASPELPYIVEFINKTGIDGGVGYEEKIINAAVAYIQNA